VGNQKLKLEKLHWLKKLWSKTSKQKEKLAQIKNQNKNRQRRKKKFK